jgi:uroporphyrinogen-III synthase
MPDGQALRVVVTRPAAQADGLCRQLAQQGYAVLRFPVLEIAAPRDAERLDATLARLAAFDLAIFVSVNAVAWALRRSAQTPALNAWPSTVSIAAIGQATARALAEHGLPVMLQAPAPYDSEALLALPQMQAVAGRRILILRGEGGREHLAQALRERGAVVEYAECYRRVLPSSDPAPLTAAWRAGQPLLFIVTSNEGLDNLYRLVGADNRASLLASPLIVVSERARAKARQLGFQQTPILAPAASDDAIVSALQRWREREPQT